MLKVLFHESASALRKSAQNIMQHISCCTGEPAALTRPDQNHVTTDTNSA